MRALADNHSEVLNFQYLIEFLTQATDLHNSFSGYLYLSPFSGSFFKLRRAILSTVNQHLCLRGGRSRVVWSTTWASEPDFLTPGETEFA